MLLDLKKLITDLNISVEGVIQAGAHYGQEQSVYDELLIPPCNRYYFEPQPKVYEVLVKNIAGRGHTFNFALGNTTGKVKMYVENDNQSQSSSLLEPGLHAIQYPHIRFTETIDVDLFRLDDVFPSSKLNCNWLYSLDCQGFELEVLKGSQKILPFVQALLCEVNIAEVYKGCAMLDEIDSFLLNFGLKRVALNLEGVSWGDAFYIKC